MIREVMVFSSVIITVGLLTQSHMRIRLMDWLLLVIISGGFTTGWL